MQLAVPCLFKANTVTQSHKLRALPGPGAQSPSIWPQHTAPVLFLTSSLQADLVEFISAFPPLGFCSW